MHSMRWFYSAKPNSSGLVFGELLIESESDLTKQNQTTIPHKLKSRFLAKKSSYSPYFHAKNSNLYPQNKKKPQIKK